jgi:hypothetical protein
MTIVTKPTLHTRRLSFTSIRAAFFVTWYMGISQVRMQNMIAHSPPAPVPA